jgi:hypothetical protein
VTRSRAVVLQGRRSREMHIGNGFNLHLTALRPPSMRMHRPQTLQGGRGSGSGRGRAQSLAARRGGCGPSSYPTWKCIGLPLATSTSPTGPGTSLPRAETPLRTGTRTRSERTTEPRLLLRYLPHRERRVHRNDLAVELRQPRRRTRTQHLSIRSRPLGTRARYGCRQRADRLRVRFPQHRPDLALHVRGKPAIGKVFLEGGVRRRRDHPPQSAPPWRTSRFAPNEHAPLRLEGPRSEAQLGVMRMWEIS